MALPDQAKGKPNWRARKLLSEGYTEITVKKGQMEISVRVTAYNARTMSQREFNRIIKRLREAIEAYDQA